MRGIGIFASSLLALILLYAGISTANVSRVAEPEIYIVSPADGAVVESPVVVKLGIRNAQAGSTLELGHRNLVVNLEKNRQLRMPISGDDQKRLLDGGQAETSIGLVAGSHTLRIALGDYPDEAVSAPINIRVR